MRKEIVLDIETRNTFQDVGAYNPYDSLTRLFLRIDTFESRDKKIFRYGRFADHY